ncbi:MAG: HAMP domain-containing sensor histidine kinase [Acidimicrobiia bacterium]|nr:HAMP domain-containing sensor histidine kinase [Acidimicrobiia bacterium]
MRKWIERVRAWVDVGYADPVERIERAMVRVFIPAAALLSAVGLFDLIRLRTPESAVQFIAAGLLTLFTVWMDRSGRAYPRTVLALAAVAGLVSVTGATIDEDYLRLTDASPTVIIALTGVLALILGGKWVKHVAWFWTCLLIAVVSIARWPVTNSVAQVFTDIATTLIVSALAFTAVIAIRNATQQSRADYERLMETAPVGVVALDLSDVRADLHNKGVFTFTDYEKGTDEGSIDPFPMLASVKVTGFNQIAGSDLFLARGPADVAGIDRDSARVITDVLARIVFNDGPGSIELSFDADGADYHQVLNWNADSEDRRNVVLISTDITAQKAAEHALASQIRYKDEFIATVSHELRTPLTAVVGLVDEITRADASISESERDELLGIVAEQSHDVADIVEDLLVAARAAGGNLSVLPARFHLSETVAQTLTTVDEAFTWELEDELIAFADPSRVRQVIRNLVTNAVRYGGTNRRVLAFSNGDFAVVEVRDDGAPVPLQQREAMFQPYARTRKAVEGQPESVGLGLTVAKSLATIMNGDLTYEHDGQESVFRLTLPPSYSG